MLNSLIEASAFMDTSEPADSADSADTAADSAAGSGLSSDPAPVVGEGIFGMFTDNKEETAPPEQAETPADDEVTGIINENKEESVDIPEPKVVDDVAKDDDEPEVVPY